MISDVPAAQLQTFFRGHEVQPGPHLHETPHVQRPISKFQFDQ